MYQKRFSLLLLSASLMIVGCASKNPAGLGSNRYVPVISADKIKTNPVYFDVLKGEYQSEGEESGDLNSLEEMLKKDPQSNYLKIQLAYGYAKTEKISESISLLESILAETPKNLDALFLYARVLAVKGDFDKSKAVFLQILDLQEILEDPDQKLEVSFILATVYIEKGELVRAEEIFKTIIKENPDHLMSYYYLGRVYSEQGKMKEAIETYKTSVDIDSRFSLGWKALGLIYEYTGDKDQALDAYERVVAAESMNVEARTKLVDFYIQKNELKKAIEQVLILKRMYPGVPDVSIRLGLFYFQEKMFSEAETEFTEAAKNFSKNTDIYYYLGLSQYQLKKPNLAKKNFSKVAPESQVYPVAQLALSTMLEDSGDSVKAEKVLSSALEKKPASIDLRTGLASFFIRKSQLDQAKKVLEDGILLAPKEEKLLLSLAEIFERKKQFDDLEKTVRSVLAINPESASALNFLGYSYAERNINLKEAEEMVVKALKIRPDDAFIQDSLGWIFFRKKEFKKSEEILNKALGEMPNEPVILEHMGDVLSAQGRVKEAVERYQQSLKFSNEKNKKNEIEKKIKNISH